MHFINKEDSTILRSIEMPHIVYCGLIIGDILFIAGYKYMQMYSLPDFSLIKQIGIKDSPNKLLPMDDPSKLLIGEGGGYIEIVDIKR